MPVVILQKPTLQKTLEHALHPKDCNQEGYNVYTIA